MAEPSTNPMQWRRQAVSSLGSRVRQRPAGTLTAARDQNTLNDACVGGHETRRARRARWKVGRQPFEAEMVTRSAGPGRPMRHVVLCASRGAAPGAAPRPCAIGAKPVAGIIRYHAVCASRAVFGLSFSCWQPVQCASLAPCQVDPRRTKWRGMKSRARGSQCQHRSEPGTREWDGQPSWRMWRSWCARASVMTRASLAPGGHLWVATQLPNETE